MWRRGDDDDDEDDGGMFGFSRGGSMAMAKKMMGEEEIEWVTPGQEPNKAPAAATSVVAVSTPDAQLQASAVKQPQAGNMQSAVIAQQYQQAAPVVQQTFVPVQNEELSRIQNSSRPTPIDSQANSQTSLNNAPPNSQFGSQHSLPGQSIFINQHGQPVNQFGQLLQFNQFGQAFVVPNQQGHQEHNHGPNSPNTPSSTGSVNPMQASVFGGGSNSISLSKQFAAGSNMVGNIPGSLEMEYLQAVQQEMQQQQLQQQRESSIPSVNSARHSNHSTAMPVNQMSLTNEISYASTLSGSSSTIPISYAPQSSVVQAQGQPVQMFRETSLPSNTLSSNNSLIINRSPSTPSLKSVNSTNRVSFDDKIAVSNVPLTQGGRVASMDNAVTLIRDQSRMNSESSTNSVVSQQSGNRIPPPSPNDPYSLVGKAEKVKTDEPLNPALVREYEKAVNAFGGKKPEDSDDDEGIYDKGFWGGGTSSLFLSKSSLGSRESSLHAPSAKK